VRTDVRRAEEGSVLVWALLFVVITSGMVISHSLRLSSQRRDLDALFDRKVLARSVASSGVVDALAWFREQATQPVRNFTPQFDPAGDPPALDTIDPALGLVREFEIRGNLWGRYELRNAEARDISAERGINGNGKAWGLQVRSFVYRIADPEKPFDEAPNRVVAADTLSTEFCSLGLSLPALAPIAAQDPEAVTFFENVIINGGSQPGMVHGDGPTDTKDYSDPGETALPGEIGDVAAVSPFPIRISVDPILSPLSTLVGNPPKLRAPTLGIDITRIFGVRADELRAFSDFVGSNVAEIEKAGGGGRLVFVPGDLIIDQGIQLDASVLVINGSLGVPSNPEPTVIRGIVYVEGDAKILGNFKLEGSLIAKHRLVLGESGGGAPVEIQYSAPLVQRLQASLRDYRVRRGMQSN
jgi:hypothetical protein